MRRTLVAALFVVLLVSAEGLAVSHTVHSFASLNAGLKAVHDPTTVSPNLAKNMQAMIESPMMRTLYGMVKDNPTFQRLPGALAKYPHLTQALIQSDAGKKAFDVVNTVDALTKATLGDRPLNTIPETPTAVREMAQSLPATHQRTWTKFLNGTFPAGFEDVNNLQLGGRNLTSVTQVTRDDGSVITTTKVYTEDTTDGNARTIISHEDEDGTVTERVIEHDTDDLRHKFRHFVRSDEPEEEPIVVVDGILPNITNATRPAEPVSDGEQVPDRSTDLLSVDPDDIHGWAAKIQKYLDWANYMWFVGMVLGFLAMVMTFPAMEGSKDAGSLTWSFWSAIIVVVAYVITCGGEMMSLHHFMKHMVVWLANLLLHILRYSDELTAKAAQARDAGNDLYNRARDHLDPDHHHHLSHHAAAALLSTTATTKQQHTIPGDTSLVQSQAQVKPGDVMTYITTVPYQDLPNGGENMCKDAWSNSDTAHMSSDRQLYYSREGPVDTWSPVARWNLRRTANQKKIPNPSDCSTNDHHQCPGNILFLEGGEDYCDCMEVLSRLGYDIEVELMMQCMLSRRDYIFNALSSLFKVDELNAKYRNQQVEKYLDTNAECVATQDAGVASTILPTAPVIHSYLSSGFPDNMAFDEDYATLSGPGGLSWAIANCLAGDYVFEFRYSAPSNVDIEIAIDSTVHTLSDQTSTLLATGDDVFMRGNAVVGPVSLETGTHTISLKMTSGTGPLYVHRFKSCVDGTVKGCHVSASAEVSCYESKHGVGFAAPLVGFEGSGVGFSSLEAAMNACSSRSDCSGIIETTDSDGMVLYQCRGGAEQTASNSNALAYARKLGWADSRGMCPS